MSLLHYTVLVKISAFFAARICLYLLMIFDVARSGGLARKVFQ
jgi:hypothetical protein